MVYILEVGRGVVHASETCEQLPRQTAGLRHLPSALDLNDALKSASAMVNRDGSVPPTSINACLACNW